MSTSSPAVSMKRRSTRLAAAVMTSGALVAVGIGGVGSANANPSPVSCISLVGNIICNAANGNTVTITDVVNIGNVDLNALNHSLSNIDINLVNVENVLNPNIKCNNVTVVVGGIVSNKACNW